MSGNWCPMWRRALEAGARNLQYFEKEVATTTVVADSLAAAAAEKMEAAGVKREARRQAMLDYRDALAYEVEAQTAARHARSVAKEAAEAAEVAKQELADAQVQMARAREAAQAAELFEECREAQWRRDGETERRRRRDSSERSRSRSRTLESAGVLDSPLFLPSLKAVVVEVAPLKKARPIFDFCFRSLKKLKVAAK